MELMDGMLQEVIQVLHHGEELVTEMVIIVVILLKVYATRIKGEGNLQLHMEILMEQIHLLQRLL